MSQLYTRVFVQILDSSIAEDFTLRHIFEDLFKLCDYKTGIVDMTRQALSRRLNVPLDLLNESIAKLEAPDPSSRDLEHEGRRIERLDEHRDWGWRILNWNKYESIRTRAAGAERASRYRDKKQQNGEELLPIASDGAPKPWQPTSIQTRLGQLFKRRPTTRWNRDEIKALKDIGEISEEDMVLLETYYTAKHKPESDYRRRDLATLLNNFNGELDRARKYKPTNCF
jgi:hypothetical protein